MTNIAIFASGEGTNAENLIKYFNYNDKNIRCNLVVTNNSNAGVINRGKLHNVDVVLNNFKTPNDIDVLVATLNKYNTNFIILAGFLKLIPSIIIEKYNEKILNIHPALLPAYGGKGMYGMNVHKAVIENKERYSGITIHLVNEEYDKGKILFQKRIDIQNISSVDELAKQIHELEYRYYPEIIECYVRTMIYC